MRALNRGRRPRMPLGKPSSGVLLKIHGRAGEKVNRRTLAWLRDQQLAKPRPGKETSRSPTDWELTAEGRKAVRDLSESGTAYLPTEFAAERARLERSLGASTAAEAGTEHTPGGAVPGDLAVATWNLRFSSDPE